LYHLTTNSEKLILPSSQAKSNSYNCSMLHAFGLFKRKQIHSRNAKIQQLKPTQLFFITLSLTILAALFRLPNLDNLPSGFFGDEAALAYNAWSILETGRDEWGAFMPLTLRSFDDYKPALYTYLTIPFVAVRGLTHEAARLPAAVFGSLLPALIFLLLYDPQDKKKTIAGALAGLVLIITPWHWEVSRTAIEAGVAVTLTVALLVTLKATTKLQTRSLGWWLTFVGFTLLGISILFTYHTARLIMPAILISGVLLGQFKTNWIQKLSVAVLTVAGLGLALTASSARYSQISLFSDPGVAAMRTEASFKAGVGGVPAPLTRLYHNKPLSWAQTYLDSYLTNTSLTYLFVGGAQPQRASIPETGQFLWIFLPFFILGLVASARRGTHFDIWMAFWLLIAPAAASLTTAEIPHVYRTLFLLVPISVFIGTGLLWSVDLLISLLQQAKNRLGSLPKKHLELVSRLIVVVYVGTLTLAIGGNTAKAWHQFSIQQALNQPWYRQYGYKELYEYLNSLPENEVSQVIITNREMEPYIFYLFYNKIHPSIYQAQPNKRLSHDNIHFNGARQWQLFNMTFSEEKCPYDTLDTDPTHLYVVGLNCTLPSSFERVRNINFKDGVPMFHIDRPKKSDL